MKSTRSTLTKRPEVRNEADVIHSGHSVRSYPQAFCFRMFLSAGSALMES